ncbi:MAG: hypothetical protein FWG65_12830 [Turicibacter sp.]|nr:hypothetical protein [Turicibacter sp.]
MFDTLTKYLELNNGLNREELDWQMLFELFPQFDFPNNTAYGREYGKYFMFGEDNEYQRFDRIVRCRNTGKEMSFDYWRFNKRKENRIICY